MKKFLLVLSTTQQSGEAISYALNIAKNKDAELYVLFILDSVVPATIFEKLTDIGFIGDKPSSELTEAITKEYEEQAVQLLKDIEKRAADTGISCKTFIEQGDFAEVCLEAIARFAADMIILNRTRKSALSRLLIGSKIDRLLRKAPCEIKIFEGE